MIVPNAMHIHKGMTVYNIELSADSKDLLDVSDICRAPAGALQISLLILGIYLMPVMRTLV